MREGIPSTHALTVSPDVVYGADWCECSRRSCGVCDPRRAEHEAHVSATNTPDAHTILCIELLDETLLLSRPHRSKDAHVQRAPELNGDAPCALCVEDVREQGSVRCKTQVYVQPQHNMWNAMDAGIDLIRTVCDEEARWM